MSTKVTRISTRVLSAVDENVVPGVSARIVLLMAVAVFINYVDRGNLATAAPLVQGELGLSNTRVGVLLSAFFWTYTAAQPFAGWLAQRFDTRIVYAVGVAIWSLATTLTGVVAGFMSLLVLRLLLGIGESVTFPCTSKILAESGSEYERGRANGLISAGCGLGPTVGTLVGGILMAEHGWRSTFLVFGLCSLLWLWPWLSSTRPADHVLQCRPHIVAYSRILKKRALWGSSLGHFSFNYGYYFVLTWVPLFLVNSRGFSISQMAIVGAVVCSVFALTAALTSWVFDCLIAAGGSINAVRKAAIVTSVLGAACAMLVCSSASAKWSVIMLGIAGFFFGLGSPQIFAIAQTLSGPRAGGQWMGIQNTVGNLAGVVAPIITGWTVEITGRFYLAFLLTGAVLAFGSLSWGLVVPRVEAARWDEAGDA